jgi:protein ImuB
MFAVLLIPDFALQAVLRHQPQLWARPVALIDEQELKPTVMQVTRTAREQGVEEGLTSTQALARCNETLIQARSREQEEIVTAALLQTAYAFSPRIESTSEGVCTMDLQGLACVKSTLLNESLQAWGEKLVVALAQLQLRVQVGIASTPNLAWHAARRSSRVLVIDRPIDFISALPLGGLNPLPALLEILQRWGIHTVGDFTALGKDKIAERLGREGVALFDHAATQHIRPLNVITPAEVFAETMDFEIEIESLPPLLFILNRFLEQLTRRLVLSHFVARELRLRFRLSSGDCYEHTFAVPAPTANPNVLLRMLETHLETVGTESGIVALELLVQPTRSEHYQFGLFETALRDPNQFAETLARLGALCGDEKVGTPVLLDTHRPDAFRMEPPHFDTRGNEESSTLAVTLQGLTLRRFRPAIHADIDVENSTPVFISSLKLNSPIAKRCGPYRSSGDWWEEEKVWNRDEWDIQTRDGAIYRICREKQDWLVEGVYD